MILIRVLLNKIVLSCFFKEIIYCQKLFITEKVNIK